MANEKRRLLQISTFDATEFVDKTGGIYDVVMREHPTFGFEYHCTHRTDGYTVIYNYDEFQAKIAASDLLQRVKTI